MKFKFNALVAALALIASAGAHAGVANGVTAATFGNSSAVLIAIDNANSVSLTVDLGVSLTDFLQPASFVGASAPAGSLAYTGAPLTASWNLANNTRSVNGAAVTGDFAWSGAVSSFLATAGSNYTWAVVAGDNLTGATSATNYVQNRNVLATFNNLDANKINGLTTALQTSNAAANVTTFLTASTSGTLQSNADGAGTATAGSGFVGAVIKGNFGAYSGWNYLNAVGASAPVFLINQQSNPIVYQIGKSYGTDSLLAAADAASFTFDGTTLSYSVAAVPEASTIAMMLAGLGAVGFMARRRKAA